MSCSVSLLSIQLSALNQFPLQGGDDDNAHPNGVAAS